MDPFRQGSNLAPVTALVPASIVARVAGVEVWVADVSGMGEAAGALLTDAERTRAAGFRSAPAKALFVASRALQRVLGARYLGVPAGDVVVERRCHLCGDQAHGRPYLVGSDGLDFSVSHSGTRVVLGYAAGRRIGVDIEADDRKVDPAALSSHVLSASELTSLQALAGDERRRAFLALWSRKEAAVKLTGHGLVVPLSHVSVSGPTVRVSPVPEGWPGEPIGLAPLALDSGYSGALAYTGELPGVTVRSADEFLR
jgi:4'-phosphopantetheinyl transferase